MATSTLLPVFREAVSLSSSGGMTVYNLPSMYPATGGLGIVVGVVTLATNVLLAYPKISTPYKKQLLPSKRPFRYNPPSAVSTIHSLRRTHAKAISALIQEHKGFGDYMNGTDFSPFGLVTNGKKGSLVKKFQCKSKKNNDQESSGPKICAIIVGTSFCIAIAILCLGFPKKLGLCHTTVVPYSCLVNDIRYKRVTHVQFVKGSSLINYNTNTAADKITETSKTVLGRTKLGKAFVSKQWEYQTIYVGNDMSPLIEYLKHHKIAYGSDPKPLTVTPKDVLSFIFERFPYFICLVLECYLISTQLNLWKRKKRKEQPVTFADVEGVDDAKAELLKIVSCLNNKDRKDRKLGSKLPKGVLLTGPPGTGKTLLARALATEAGVSFHAVSGTEFVELYVGMGAARVRQLFEKARKSSAPSIIFIDEIDAVGGQRGTDNSNSEGDQTLNQLLIEMDGFYKDDNVMVLAATNIPEKLDPALLRADRFTTKVVVGLPDQEGRQKIFDIYMRNVPMQEDKAKICDYVAQRTEGLVGSDLKEIADESERLAAHRDGDFVTFDDVRQAVDKAQQNYQTVKMMRIRK